MKKDIENLFNSNATLNNFGCVYCSLVINSQVLPMSLSGKSDEEKSLLVELGINADTFTSVTKIIKKYMKEFVEADTLLFERNNDEVEIEKLVKRIQAQINSKPKPPSRGYPW